MRTRHQLAILALGVLVLTGVACGRAPSAQSPTPVAMQGTPTATATATVTSPDAGTPLPSPTPTAAPTGFNVGQQAPAFTVTTIDGRTLTLEELRATGDPVLLFFFTTW